MSDIDIICLAKCATRVHVQTNPIQEGPSKAIIPLQELTELALILNHLGNVLLWYFLGAVSLPNQVHQAISIHL